MNGIKYGVPGLELDAGAGARVAVLGRAAARVVEAVEDRGLHDAHAGAGARRVGARGRLVGLERAPVEGREGLDDGDEAAGQARFRGGVREAEGRRVGSGDRGGLDRPDEPRQVLALDEIAKRVESPCKSKAK